MPDNPLPPSQRFAVLALALIFVLIPFGFIGDLEMRGFHIRDLEASGFFFSLGLLPGVLGIVYHLVVARTRPLERYGAVAASLLLTGIFLLIAVFAGYEASEQRGVAANGVQGMMYAGLGAYIAVLYYMVARLYANALSARFLMTSALRTASAVVLGWVFGIVGVTAVLGVPGETSATANAVVFIAGLFHNMAIDALRRRATKLFGSARVDSDELPLTAVEGIDDTTAELLSEHGVGSIQHLATSDVDDLCERMALPRARVVDWIDQALLIRSLRAGIGAARALGIRTASDLGRADAALLAVLGEKSAVPSAALDQLAADLRDRSAPAAEPAAPMIPIREAAASAALRQP